MIPIYDHIFLNNDYVSTEKFTTPLLGRSTARIPGRDRDSQAARLRGKLNHIWENATRERKERKAISLPSREGTYLEFIGKPGYDLVTKSLENRSNKIALLNVKNISTEEGNLTKATVFIPKGKERYFLNKVTEYAEKNTEKNLPKNAPLINSIEDIKLAMLESFWRESEKGLIPEEIKNWCEVWIRISEEPNDDLKNNEIIQAQLEEFKALLERNHIEFKSNIITFPERAILLIHANRNNLMEIINQSDQITEFRIAQEVSSLWTSESNIAQTEWALDLKNRLTIEESSIKICLLDSGVNNGHILLEDIISNSDCLTIDPSWGTDDRSEIAANGHGTLMAGLSGYGNLQRELESDQETFLTHQLCSVKILPRRGQSPKEAWGEFMWQAAYRAEKANPRHSLLYCMAVTSADDVDMGRPSSWSGAVDKLCFGDQSLKRLLLVSAGNLREEIHDYPDCNIKSSVQNPAQSWNALTIGAFTEKIQIDDPRLSRHPRVAQPGEISPHTTTSVSWENKWPIKPEVLWKEGTCLYKIKRPMATKI